MSAWSPKEIEVAVLKAKKSMTVEQIKEAVYKSSCGGPITSKSEYKRLDCQGITMDSKGGVNLGKTLP